MSHRSRAIRRNSKNVIPISKHSAIYFAEYAENEFPSVNVAPLFPKTLSNSLVIKKEARSERGNARAIERYIARVSDPEMTL